MFEGFREILITRSNRTLGVVFLDDKKPPNMSLTFFQLPPDPSPSHRGRFPGILLRPGDAGDLGKAGSLLPPHA